MNLALQTIPSTMISEVFCKSSLDGVLLDTEHGYFNNETLYSCIQVITLSGKKCFVRFTDLNKQLIRMCLDAGVDGLVFSTIEDKLVGKDIIEYCNYPSFGGKRGTSLVRENIWGDLPMSNRKPIIVGQIETKTAVDNIQEIYECGFDFYLIGPYDLSASLGCTRQWDHMLFNQYMDKIHDTIPTDKLAAFLPTVKDIERFYNSKRKRPSMLIWGLDVNFIMEGVKALKLQ